MSIQFCCRMKGESNWFNEMEQEEVENEIRLEEEAEDNRDE